jgi:hypothetical protein
LMSSTSFPGLNRNASVPKFSTFFKFDNLTLPLLEAVCWARYASWTAPLLSSETQLTHCVGGV